MAEELDRETGSGWGWFVALGAILIVLGACAFFALPHAGDASVNAVGLFMLIGALAQLTTMLLAPHRRGIGLLALSAILYGAAGILAIANPMLSAPALTVMLAFALICSGMIRVRLTSVMPSSPGWGWLAASGFVSVISGFGFIHLLFAHAVWLLGIALAADLTFQGATALAFGLIVSKRTSSARSSSPMEP